MVNITTIEQISVITFGNIPFDSESSFVFSIFEAAAAENISVDMISKASVSTDRTSVGFTFRDDDMPQMLSVLSRITFYRPPLVSCGNVKFVIKSADMAEKPGFAMNVFKALSDANITPILVTTSLDEISAVVRESDSSDFMNALKTVLN